MTTFRREVFHPHPIARIFVETTTPLTTELLDTLRGIPGISEATKHHSCLVSVRPTTEEDCAGVAKKLSELLK